ncbi:MAG: hypothetical protein U0835_27300 [Isosphaeraceae bacterium]
MKRKLVVASRSMVLSLLTIMGTSTARAQPPPGVEPTTLVVRPAAQPVPALKYRLVPERRELAPGSGNAAVYYHRAMQLLVQGRVGREQPAKPQAGGTPAQSAEELVMRWTAGPISAVPRDEARRQIATFENVLREVELGARQPSCDWEFDQRDEVFTLLLPEIQEMRSLARIVALRASLATLDGKTDEAAHWIQTGLVMGRHVGHGPILIQALVGVAIDWSMLKCLEDLIQAPGTPSLYWALADRPRPFIDMRYPLEGERYILERELPALGGIERGVWSTDEVRRFADEFQRKVFPNLAGEPIPGFGTVPRSVPEFGGKLTLALMAARVYPQARRALVDGGMPESRADELPVIQAAALYSYQEFRRVRDESYKWLNVPYWQSYDRVDRASSITVDQKLANPILALFRFYVSALNSARLASVRLERRFDALQCVEAVRLYAHEHGGSFPTSLAGLADSPVPLDPGTGKPFEYRSDGATATLSAPAPPGAPDNQFYLIRYVFKSNK